MENLNALFYIDHSDSYKVEIYLLQIYFLRLCRKTKSLRMKSGLSTFKHFCKGGQSNGTNCQEKVRNSYQHSSKVIDLNLLKFK